MNKYLITLTPIDKFFFGGELTFTRSKRENIDKQRKDLNDAEDKELKSFDESFGSYFVRSKQFPQQTSLLGMLRFAFLSANDKAFKNGEIIEKKEAIETIGAESFNVDSGTEMRFGKIKKIYPCFLQRKTDKDDWSNLVVAPMDYKLTIEFNKGEALLNNRKLKIPYIPKYNPKVGITSYCIGDNIAALETGKLFKEDIRIGIDRNFDGEPKEGAFYKQISYRLSDKYEFENKTEEDHQLRFAFYAELDEDLQEQIVTLGGDNSRFKLTCQLKEGELQLPESNYLKKFDGYEGKVVLLSDAFIGQDVMNNCLFSINEIVPFRFLKSTVGTTTGYYKFSSADKQNPTHLRRSEQKFNLYKTGSVFYFDSIGDMNKFTEALESEKRFRQIGYNFYKPFPKKTIITNK